MKALIINSNTNRQPWPVAPIGAAYAASALDAAGFQVKFLDLAFSASISEDIHSSLNTFSPDIIGISIRNIDNTNWISPHFYIAEIKEKIIDKIKECTTVPIILGGAAVSINPIEILKFTGCRYAVLGDGEKAIVELANKLLAGQDPGSIMGVAVLDIGRQVINPPNRVEDMSNVLFHRVYKWVNYHKYDHNYSSYPIQTKRGCILKCTYCVYNYIEGVVCRLRDPVNIADEIEDAVSECRPRVFEFIDSIFNVPKEHAEKILEEIKKRKLKIKLQTMGLAPIGITPEFIILMKEAGFSEVYCTPEAASDVVLEGLGKSFRKQDLIRSAQILNQSGLPVVWYFLFGGPGETKETVREAFEFIEKYTRKQDLVYITIGVRIYKGAKLTEMAIQNNQISKDANLLEPVWFQPEGIDLKELYYLVKKEILIHPNCVDIDVIESNRLYEKLFKLFYGILHISTPLWQNIGLRYKISELSGLNAYKLRKLKNDFESGKLLKNAGKTMLSP